MDRSSLILAALSPAKSVPHTPVQIQKMLFLLDKNVSKEIGGPHFNFQPYDYGPFDQAVYVVLEELATKNLVSISEELGRRWKTYSLTADGQKAGENLLKQLDNKTQHYLVKLSEFVLSLSFAQLVSAIYKAYPDMKVRSVFKE